MQHVNTPPAPSSEQSSRLTDAAAALGYEIVDIAGFLDLVEEHAQAQSSGLSILRARADDMTGANSDVMTAVQSMAEQTRTTVKDVEASAALVRSTGEKSREVAGWVQQISLRTEDLGGTLSDVRTNNQQIATIATQVNTLAINAKIEAARAGESGRGFAVVAEAINELSRQTRDAASQISKNIETLANWISQLRDEAGTIAEHATEVLDNAGDTDSALKRVESSVNSADMQATRISEQAERVDRAMMDFAPALVKIENAIKGTSSGIAETHDRVLRLIDTSETIVQSTAHLNANSEDSRFIAEVLQRSAEVSQAMEEAIKNGRTTMSRLFDRNYRPIPNTNPEQVMTEATSLLDDILPPLQEPVLRIDPKVVFCAAVDVNGYLPTHNKKFSQPPSNDPVWNTANCRNRRIFDDRVGLKAGRNTEPFLLQVYRRDMGGGTFKMMKDLSAPIIVQGRHWGGLRLAYSF
ncbi:MAG: methyl-accepting chemotaxis protein [Roseobacter sp.]|jgi:methyl-accepting chemotaxis protein|nr:methyl-accepting chemotaxis protein [Roseobacter sp.]